MKKPNKKRELMNLTIFADEATELFQHLNSIEKSIKKGNEVPPERLKRLVKIIKDPINKYKEIEFAIFQHLKETTLTFFKKHKDYCYEGDGIYSFEYLIAETYDSILPTPDNFNVPKEKRDFVRKIYRNVDYHIEQVFTKKEYSVYKRKVITAFISAQFGILKTEEKHNDSDYTTYLFDRIKSYLKDFT